MLRFDYASGSYTSSVWLCRGGSVHDVCCHLIIAAISFINKQSFNGFDKIVGFESFDSLFRGQWLASSSAELIAIASPAPTMHHCISVFHGQKALPS